MTALPNRRRRILLSLAAGPLVAALPLPLRALERDAKKVGVLGRGSGGIFNAWQESFPKSFAAHGFVKGRNLDLRFYGVEMPLEKAEHARPQDWVPIWRSVVAKMVSDQLDCIVTNAEPATRYLVEQTHSVPIVTHVADPVGLGVAKTLGHPGGNVTGTHSGDADVCVKTVELFRRLIPGLAKMGWVGWGPFLARVKPLEAAVRSLGMEFHPVLVETMDPSGFEKARRAFAQFRSQGVLAAMLDIPDDAGMKAMFAQAIESRIAVAGGNPNWDGHLLSYGGRWTKDNDPDERLPAIASRILRGERPGDIPFEGPTEYDLYVNLRTAAKIGIAIPPDIRLLATRLIG